MSRSKLRFAIPLVVFTVAASLLVSCILPLQGLPPLAKGSFFLEFNNAFAQLNPSGNKTPSDIPVVWEGSRQLGSEEKQAAEDTFNIVQTPTVNKVATDAWFTTRFVQDLNAGDWNLSVTVDGKKMSCGSPITLAPKALVNVTFQVSKDTGDYTGCTHS